MGKAKNWTPEEREYLENHWGDIPIPTIAAHLDRSIEGVKIKAQRWKLGRHIHRSVKMTLNEFCKAIGKSYSLVKTRWVRLGLPISYQRSVNKRYAMLDIDKFWEWAEQHKDIIPFNNFPDGTFGEEPKWAKAARRAAYVSKTKRTPWTKDEDERLERMLKEYKYTYHYLSEHFNRTEGAIKRRIFDLKLPYRPLRANDKMWKDSEVEELVKLRAAGYSWERIGEKLNRSALSVRGKYERLLNPDYVKLYNQKQVLRDYFQKDQCANYKKALGCTINGTNCDSCPHFKRRDPDAGKESGWVSMRYIPPELLADIKKEGGNA